MKPQIKKQKLQMKQSSFENTSRYYKRKKL